MCAFGINKRQKIFESSRGLHPPLKPSSIISALSTFAASHLNSYVTLAFMRGSWSVCVFVQLLSHNYLEDEFHLWFKL